MPNASLYINQIDTDHEFYVWGSGNNISLFTEGVWQTYDYTNSVVPSDYGGSYYLDTRCLSIDPQDILWCGVAQGPTSGFNEVAVFSMNTNDVYEGKPYLFSDISNFNGVQQEVCTIYASPFGSEVLAFVCPLNGIGGTAGITAYTKFYGVTGGRLFYLNLFTGEWNENVPNYTWPHIYDIKAKGFDGNRYLYYLGTEEGLYEISAGILETFQLNYGGETIKQAQIFNTNTSGIISDKVYCIDLDEDSNLWIGTDQGLSFYNGYKFWNYGTSGPVTSIKSRPNGHVFYGMGDAELGQGIGLWHFNGSTHTQFTPANSDLGNSNVLGLELIGHNIQQGDLLATENSFWVLENNNISLFEYDIPHVYGSSNYAGATGWNFVYYSPTGATGAPLPKVNKYTWAYPEWRVYQDEYLAQKFPGLDPRNLFLTTSLKEIANGRAGRQPWWNDYPIPSFEQEQQLKSFVTPSWISDLTVYQGTSGSTGSGVFLETQTVLNINGVNKVYIGGYLKGNITVNFGYYNDSAEALISNTNPTFLGRAQPDQSSSDTVDMGFVVCYNESGAVESFVNFPGYSTRVQSISPSRDGSSIYVTGTYLMLVENGPFIFEGTIDNVINSGGPTGAPSGLNTDLYPGSTSGIFPWIYSATGATGSPYIFSYGTTGPTSGVIYNYSQGSTASSPGLCDFNNIFNPASTYDEIYTVRLNFADINFTWLEIDYTQIPTGYVLEIQDASSPSAYSYFQINKIYLNESAGIFESSPQTANFDVTYSGGSGSQVIPASSLRFSFVSYLNDVFPLLPSIDQMMSDIDNGYWHPGFFGAQIDKNLGDFSTYTGLTSGNYQSQIDKGYKFSNFRQFPSDGQYDQSVFDSLYSIGDAGDYSLNVSVASFADQITPEIPNFWTLKNEWNRNSDLTTTLDKLIDPDYLSVSQTTGLLSFIRLDSSDFSLLTTTSAAGGTTGVVDYGITSVESLSTNNTTLITGTSNYSFSVGGINLSQGATGSTGPYYLILDSFGNGVTGGFISNYVDMNIPIKASKTESTYFVTTVVGSSGYYFGDYFTAGTTGTYFLTAEITEQGVSKNIFAPKLEVVSGSGQNVINILDQKILPDGLAVFAYQSSVKPYINIFKADQTGKITNQKDFGDLNCESEAFSLTFDNQSNVYIAGFNSTGLTGDSFIVCGPTSAFVLQSEKYNFDPGINLGDIISRPGSGAWTWCDVHSSENYLDLPLMSTVIFSNYNSSIYGKANNTWSLIDSITGNDLLTVKLTPYFIYTFTEPGYFTIYNKVEDSQGNVYEISKPGFIEIKDHKIKTPEDPRPDFVDSRDYGFPDPPFESRDVQAQKLAKQLLEDEAQILDNNKQSFGSSLIIFDDPDATFRDLSDNTV